MSEAMEGPPGALRGKRILVCGKGGSGKSSFVALAAEVLLRRAYDVVVLDGDASNPEGLVRLLFGTGVEGEPRPLLEFFGGPERVGCPVDDPSALRRLHDATPVPERPIEPRTEVPAAFCLRKAGLTFLQVGKISHYGQGCDGPAEKVVRDFLLAGDAVSLVDMKAGVEHFGRRITAHMDVVIGLLDCTLESVSIARRIAGFCEEAGAGQCWLVLNKVGSPAEREAMARGLGGLEARVLGSIPFDAVLHSAALAPGPLPACPARARVGRVLEALERRLTRPAAAPS